MKTSDTMKVGLREVDAGDNQREDEVEKENVLGENYFYGQYIIYMIMCR